MANIGSLFVDVNADTTGLEAGLERATKATGRYRDAAGRMREANGKFASSANAAGGAIENTGRKAATASTAFAGLRTRLRQVSGLLASIGLGIGLASSVRQVADFQVAMNGLAATSNATAEQMERLESQARTLGATSKFSAQQAAEGQRFLAMAGFDVNEVLGATPGILKLATAAQIDLGTAADIASNVLGGMRLEVSELNRVNDVLAATASRSNTTIQQLGQALSFAAPFAAGAGISIEEAAAAIGNMSDAGIQASRAGTGLVGVIRQLSNVAGPGEEVLDKYSLSLADVDIEARGLGPVLETLRSKNMSAADSIKLFGSEAGAAAQVLVNDFNGGIQNATGEADRMAGEFEKGLTPAFLSLKSAISESVLQLGKSGLGGALEGLTRGTTGVISAWNGMSGTWAEANNVGNTARTVIEGLSVAIATLAAITGARAVQAIGSLVAAKAGLTAASFTLANALKVLGAAARFLFGPVGIIVGGLTLLYQFREELGLVPSPVKKAREEIDLLTGAIEDMNKSTVQSAMISINAQLFDLERQAKEAREEMERINNSQNVPGPLRNSMVGPAGESRQALTGIQSQQRALQERMDQLREFDEGLARTAASANGAANGAEELEKSTKNASKALDEFSAQMSPEVEDILDRAGEGSTIDANGILRDAWGNALPTLQRELDKELKLQINEFSSQQSLKKGLEAAAQRFVDGASTAVSKAWNSIKADGDANGKLMPTGDQSKAPALAEPRSAVIGWSSINSSSSGGLMPTNSQSSAPARAMQGSTSGSGKNLGTLKLASDKGGTIDVQANDDRLTKWLADTLSGTAASA